MNRAKRTKELSSRRSTCIDRCVEMTIIDRADRQTDILKVMIRRYLQIDRSSLFLAYICFQTSPSLSPSVDMTNAVRSPSSIMMMNSMPRSFRTERKLTLLTLYLHEQRVVTTILCTNVCRTRRRITSTYAIKLNFIDRLQFVFDCLFFFLAGRVYFIAMH